MANKDRGGSESLPNTGGNAAEEKDDKILVVDVPVTERDTESVTLSRFQASLYQYYFTVKDPKRLTVACSVAKENPGTKPDQNTVCGTSFKLQGNTYYNLKRHLQACHKIDKLEVCAKSDDIKLKQPTLAEFKESKTKYPNTHPKQKRYVRDIIDCFARDGMPFETVDKPGHRKLISNLDPKIDLKSRKYFMRKMQSIVKEEIVPGIRMSLKSIDNRFCHFSCDVWTSRKSEGIFCILAHYIDSDWTLKKKVLLYEPLTSSHTGNLLRGTFLKCLADHGFPSNWGGVVVSDNATNMANAFDLDNILEDGEWTKLWSSKDVFDDSEDDDSDDDDIEEDEDMYTEDIMDPLFLESLITEFASGLYNPLTDLPIHGHLRCAAHTLQLAINDSIKLDKPTVECLKYINRIMVFFKRSTKWRDELRNVCKDAPRIFMPTRWNSYLFMLERFKKTEFFTAVRGVLDRASLEQTGPDSPPMAYLRKAKELCDLLLPLGEATDKLQSESCTSNLLILAITTAYRKLQTVQASEFKDLKAALLKHLKYRMEPVMQNEEYVLAAILDPRIKLSVFCLSWLQPDRLNICSEDQAIRLITREFSNWTYNEVGQNIQTEDMGGERADLLDEDPFFGILADVPSPPSQDSELDQYLSEPRSISTSCPLKYWQCNSSRFKRLSELAKKFLAIPATSSGVERIFSISGWLTRFRRARMSSKNVSGLLMIREDLIEKELPKRGIKRKAVG